MGDVKPKNVFYELATKYDDPDKIRSLPEILRLMVTEEEASILLALPGTVREVEQKTGKRLNQVTATVNKCYRNGLIMSMNRNDGEKRYSFVDIYVDSILCDSRNNSLGPQWRELWKRWTKEQIERRNSQFNPNAPAQGLVVPIPEMIHEHDHDAICPYEDARKIVEKSRRIVVQQCPCRYRTGACDYPFEEMCMFFDGMAEYALERGHTREISKKEALDKIRRASELGLVHMTNSSYYTDASTGVEFLCNCCTCCCGILEPFISSDRKVQLGRNYYAEIDPKKCNGCGTCEARCHFDAMKVTDGTAVVNRTNCVGCGLCAYVCEPKAVALRRKKGMTFVPMRSDRHFLNPRE